MLPRPPIGRARCSATLGIAADKDGRQDGGPDLRPHRRLAGVPTCARPGVSGPLSGGQGGRVLTAHDVATVRAAEAALLARVPPGALMQRAAAGLALAAVRMLRGAPGRVPGARVALLVGAGDNGGDALLAGALLAGRGVRVDAVLLDPDRASATGLAAVRRAGGRAVDAVSPTAAAVVRAADLVVDGIVGIGGSGPLRPAAAALVAAAADAGVPVLAVDLPSGVDADTGTVAGDFVRATRTVTFGTLKPAHCVDPGAAACGEVELVDIGLGPYLPSGGALQVVGAADVAAVPAPHGESQKYSRGVLGIRAGSAGYPGAAVLCTAGALAGPLGMVRFVGPDDVARSVVERFPEVVPGDGRVQAWTIGPGLGEDRGAEVAEVVDAGLPVLVDADGLRFLPQRDRRARVPDGSPVLLTPHAGELARLLGADRSAVEARRLEHATEAARRTGATVLLKGNTTVVASPDGRVRVAAAGTPYLATAGAGDVLSGFAGALLAAGLEPLAAGALGAYLHGLAARRAVGSPARQIVAADVADALPAVVAELR